MTPIERQLAPPGGWRPTSKARIAPLAMERLNAPMRGMLWAAGKWGKQRTGSDEVPAVFLLLLKHSELFWPWLRFASKLMPYGSLDRRDAELAILRVAWNCRCRYEWGQHVAIGLRAGLTPTEIARIAQGAKAPGWSPEQALVLQVCDELHHDRAISAQTWQRLTDQFNEKLQLEILLLVGHYEMLAAVLNSVGLPLDPQAEDQLAATAIHPE